MTIDVNVLEANEEFLDDIDEIIEDTMVQIFVLRADNETQLESLKQDVMQHNALFYYAPVSCVDKIDAKCVGFLVETPNDVELAKEKALYVDASHLNNVMIETLSKNDAKGIVLNATKAYPELENFYLAISAQNIERFEEGVIAKLPMEKMVLASNYPNYGFDEIFQLSKKISDKNFRPDQSIIAQATQNSLGLFGFRK
jgi:hypothetical protein